MIAAGALAERGARAEAMALGLAPVDVMTGPHPATLVSRDVVIRTATGYHMGEWRWGRTPRLSLPRVVPARDGPDDVIDAALRTADARHFLTWSRFPWARATPAEGGWRVRFGDARYETGGLGGPEVFVPGASP